MRLLKVPQPVIHHAVRIGGLVHKHSLCVDCGAVLMEIIDILSEHHLIRFIAIGGYISARALHVFALMFTTLE